MINLIGLFLLTGVAMFFVTWLAFIILMKTKHIKVVKYTLAPLWIVGWILDIVFNVIYGTLMFQQWPYFHKGMNAHHVTFTHRLKRIFRGNTYINPGDKRYKLAVFFKEKIIEPFDPSHFD